MKEKFAAMGAKFVEDKEFRETVLNAGKTLANEAKLLTMMVEDYRNGAYTRAPKAVILAIAGAVVAMALPDPVPMLDEVAIIVFIYFEFKKDIEEYRDWKVMQAENISSVKVTIGGVDYALDVLALSEHTMTKLRSCAYESISRAGS